MPVLGLVTDEYTAVKQRGALAHWAQDAVVPIVAADSEGIARLQQLWSGRHAIAGADAQRRPSHRADAAAWWDQVVAAFAPRRI